MDQTKKQEYQINIELRNTFVSKIHKIVFVPH